MIRQAISNTPWRTRTLSSIVVRALRRISTTKRLSEANAAATSTPAIFSAGFPIGKWVYPSFARWAAQAPLVTGPGLRFVPNFRFCRRGGSQAQGAQITLPLSSRPEQVWPHYMLLK